MLGTPVRAKIAEKPSLGISDILDLPLGYLNAPMPVEKIMNSCFKTFDKKPNVVLRTSAQGLLQELTVRGILYTILPSDILATWPGVTGITLDFFPSSTHRLVWNKALSHNTVFDSFLKFVKNKTLTPPSRTISSNRALLKTLPEF